MNGINEEQTKGDGEAKAGDVEAVAAVENVENGGVALTEEAGGDEGVNDVAHEQSEPVVAASTGTDIGAPTSDVQSEHTVVAEAASQPNETEIQAEVTSS